MAELAAVNHQLCPECDRVHADLLRHGCEADRLGAARLFKGGIDRDLIAAAGAACAKALCAGWRLAFHLA